MAAGAMIVVAIFAVPAVTMSGHPVSIHLLARIRRGMTAGEVKTMLGAPTTIELSNAGETWTYSGATWCYITIHIAADGTVVDVVHDH